MCPRGLLVASLVLALSAPVYGRGGGGGGVNGGRSTSQKGTVEKIVTGGIVMSSKDGRTFNVVVTPTTKMHLTGSATADFLKAGVAVEFTAEVDTKHTVKEKLVSLTVVTLTAERPAGLFSEGSKGAGPAEQDNFGFVAGGGGGADPAPADKGATKVEKHRAAAAIPLPGTYVVRGTVKSCKAGKLVVNFDHRIVKADLDDDVQIAVDMADISQARKGDAITVRGRGFRQGQGLVQAESVTIQAAEPLSGGTKKKPPKVDKKQAPSKDGSADDAGDLKVDKTPAPD